MIEILFAILAGILTLGAPCILPLLPILLGASVGQKSTTRPLCITLGFIISFSFAGLFLSTLVTQLHIAADLLHNIAAVLLALFGILLIWTKPFELLTTKLSGALSKATRTAESAGTGNFGGFILGILIGVLWTPCAGPVLGSILTLIATQADTARASILIIAYAIGAAIPMLLIAYGGQLITSKVRVFTHYTKYIQQLFGILIVLLAIAIYYNYDTKVQTYIVNALPGWNFSESKIFKN